MSHTAPAETIPVTLLTGPKGSGCLCCSIRTDLRKTLRDITWRVSRHGRRPFNRVVIETHCTRRRRHRRFPHDTRDLSRPAHHGHTSCNAPQEFHA